MRAFDEKAPVRLASACRLQWEEAQGCHVLLYPEGLLTLNAQAAEILQLCNGVNSTEVIAFMLQQKYDDESVTEDVHQFLKEVYEYGWITIT